MTGNSVVLQRRCKRVVLPELDLPTTRTLKWSMLSKYSLIFVGSIWTFLGEPCATVSPALELVYSQVYSKLSYHSLALNGKVDKNLRIDSGAMILAVTGRCKIVRRKCYFADGSQNTRRNRHTDDTGWRGAAIYRYQSERLSLTYSLLTTNRHIAMFIDRVKGQNDSDSKS